MRRTAPILIALALVACGGAAQQKRTEQVATNSLMTAAAAATTAYDLFVAWDHGVEMRIVEKAESVADGKRWLDAHRSKKLAVKAAFESVARVLKLASDALEHRDESDPDKVVKLATQALQDVLALQQAIAQLKGTVP